MRHSSDGDTERPAVRGVDARGSRYLGEHTQTRAADDDMLHAYRNPIRVFDLDDLIILVGAGVDGGVLEVGVAEAEEIEFIVHAMSPARSS